MIAARAWAPVRFRQDHGRYGYRRFHALLGNADWQIRLSVVERIWRREV